MKYLVLPLFLGLAGCAELGIPPLITPASNVTTPSATPPQRPATLDTTPPPAPPPAARTAEEFDTTSAEDRAEATQVSSAPQNDQLLGRTVASLGSPADPGFWLKTGLVDTLLPGRVEAANGRSANVELRPSGEAPTAGSQLSLPAFRVLEIPLTQLPEISVYRR